ncbi:MAG: 30S ribosomal protein S3 [Patescibacteria group bacterium]|nr:30S ribosomal protein S3 [Patescibacteria group bacterium]
MGRKVNPIGFRLAVKNSPFGWKSQWFAKKSDYKKFIMEDQKIRNFLEKKLSMAGLVGVRIERLNNMIKLVIQVSRPGIVIGRGGRGLEDIKKELLKVISVSDSDNNLDIEVEEVKNSELSAKLLAEKIAGQIERRMPYRRVANWAIESVINAGALGVKVILSGRIAGAEISRVEKFSQGKVPLSSIRANIDYFERPALTKSGYVGVKVYINRGESE